MNYQQQIGLEKSFLMPHQVPLRGSATYLNDVISQSIKTGQSVSDQKARSSQKKKRPSGVNYPQQEVSTSSKIYYQKSILNS